MLAAASVSKIRLLLRIGQIVPGISAFDLCRPIKSILCARSWFEIDGRDEGFAVGERKIEIRNERRNLL